MADAQQEPASAVVSNAREEPAIRSNEIALPIPRSAEPGLAVPTDDNTEDSRTQVAGGKRARQDSGGADGVYGAEDEQRSRKRLKDHQEISPAEEGLLTGIPSPSKVGASQQPAAAGQALVSIQLEKAVAPSTEPQSPSHLVDNTSVACQKEDIAQPADVPRSSGSRSASAVPRSWNSGVSGGLRTSFGSKPQTPVLSSTVSELLETTNGSNSLAPSGNMSQPARSFEPFEKLSRKEESNLTAEERSRYKQALYAYLKARKKASRAPVTTISQEQSNPPNDPEPSQKRMTRAAARRAANDAAVHPLNQPHVHEDQAIITGGGTANSSDNFSNSLQSQVEGQVMPGQASSAQFHILSDAGFRDLSPRGRAKYHSDLREHHNVQNRVLEPATERAAAADAQHPSDVYHVPPSGKAVSGQMASVQSQLPKPEVLKSIAPDPYARYKRDYEKQFHENTRQAEAAIALRFPLSEDEVQIKANISQGRTFYAAMPAKEVVYHNAKGRWILSELFNSSGKPLKIDELSFEVFAPLFLNVHRNSWASIGWAELRGAFGMYLTTFYQHLHGLKFGKPLLNYCRSTAKALNATEVDAAKAVAKDLLPPNSNAYAAAIPETTSTESSHNEFEIETDEAPVGVEGIDFGLQKAQLFLQRKYFPSFNMTTQRCIACSRTGHNNSSCPYMVCKTCDITGLHSDSTCPSKKRCSKCREIGHQVAACPEKLSLLRSEMSCDLCGLAGHLDTRCHTIWRSFDSQSEEILKVHEIPVNCYNCGLSGHYGPDCGLQRGPIFSGGVTWSKANLLKYVDSTSKNRPISAGIDYSIRARLSTAAETGRANDPIALDMDSDGNPVRGSKQINRGLSDSQAPNPPRGKKPRPSKAEKKRRKKENKAQKEGKHPPGAQTKAKDSKLKKAKNQIAPTPPGRGLQGQPSHSS